MEKLLKRINELANKEKSEPLSISEKTEQMHLRSIYVQIFRESFKNILLHTTIIDLEGDDVTPLKLKFEQIRYHRSGL